MALNLVLGAGLWLASRPLASTPVQNEAGSAGRTAGWRVKTNVTRVEVTLTNAILPFRWEQVQSDDLTNYVAGLRRLGCPKVTIRDIIRGELTEQYLARRRIVLDPWQPKYWDLAVHGLGKAKEQSSKELAQVKEETLERLDALVGEAKPDPEDAPPSRPDARSDFLSKEKREQLAALDKQFNALEQAAPGGGQRFAATEERKAKLKELKEQKLEAVRAVLTPEEFEEYRLRTSRYASVARGSVGFDATVEEMRTLTRTYEQFDEALRPLDRKDPAYPAKHAARQEALQQRDEALKSQLGEARFQEMRRGETAAFHSIYQVAERYELPREVAVQVDDLRRAAVENVRQVQENKALSAEQRAELLQAIQNQSRAAVRGAFGEEAARTYERNGGEWLQPR